MIYDVQYETSKTVAFAVHEKLQLKDPLNTHSPVLLLGKKMSKVHLALRVKMMSSIKWHMAHGTGHRSLRHCHSCLKNETVHDRETCC